MGTCCLISKEDTIEVLLRHFIGYHTPASRWLHESHKDCLFFDRLCNSLVSYNTANYQGFGTIYSDLFFRLAVFFCDFLEILFPNVIIVSRKHFQMFPKKENVKIKKEFFKKYFPKSV